MGVPSEYLQKEKPVTGDKRARVARFNNPITLVKVQKDKKVGQLPVIPEGQEGDTTDPTDITWTRVHVTFQSTSSTNITTVNSLNGNQLRPRKKDVASLNESGQSK